MEEDNIVIILELKDVRELGGSPHPGRAGLEYIEKGMVEFDRRVRKLLDDHDQVEIIIDAKEGEGFEEMKPLYDYLSESEAGFWTSFEGESAPIEDLVLYLTDSPGQWTACNWKNYWKDS